MKLFPDSRHGVEGWRRERERERVAKEAVRMESKR